jgi:hypothetical protein
MMGMKHSGLTPETLPNTVKDIQHYLKSTFGNEVGLRSFNRKHERYEIGRVVKGCWETFSRGASPIIALKKAQKELDKHL